MPRHFAIDSYAGQRTGRGHQAPPAEYWASQMRCNPIAALRISEKIDEWETTHHKTCPPGLVIAFARTQGLEPDEAKVKELLAERKEWRGHKALPEPGPTTYEVVVSIVPPDKGEVDPPGGIFDANTNVDFTATPVSGYKFDRWGGDASGSDNPITITIDDDKNISAHFKKIGGPP